MGRPPIGEKAMSSSERAQRHRNEKRLLAHFNKEAFTERKWILIEAAVRGPTHEIHNILFRIGFAIGGGEEFQLGFSTDYLSETMREIASRR
jgi:hypothetical protein